MLKYNLKLLKLTRFILNKVFKKKSLKKNYRAHVDQRHMIEFYWALKIETGQDDRSREWDSHLSSHLEVTLPYSAAYSTPQQ